ncbi:MAK10-like protein [Tanacetum coccineum]
MCMYLCQCSLRDQASNWLERLPAGSISTWEDLTTRFLAQFFPPGRTAKLRNDILMFQQHQGEFLSEAWTLQIFYDHVNPVTRRTIDQLVGAKLRDRNAEESWALLEDLALYENESWNDPRDFAKPVKAISLPQDVPSTSDRHLIELENQVQRLMEAHLAPKQHVQVNKITSLCEICSGPHDTQYCIKNLEQAFVEYASSLLSTRSYPTGDPQCSSHSPNSINAVKTCSKETNHSQKDQLQMVTEIRTWQIEEPEQTLEDEFMDLYLNLSVLEVLAHALMYNTILDKYVESLELGKNGSTFIQGEMPKRMEDPGLITLPCRLGDSKPFDTLADLGSCVNIIP